jgi:hypothetical protein
VRSCQRFSRLTCRKSLVPNQAHTPECSPQQRGLLRIRISPAPVRLSHPSSLPENPLPRNAYERTPELYVRRERRMKGGDTP